MQDRRGYMLLIRARAIINVSWTVHEVSMVDWIRIREHDYLRRQQSTTREQKSSTYIPQYNQHSLRVPLKWEVQDTVWKSTHTDTETQTSHSVKLVKYSLLSQSYALWMSRTRLVNVHTKASWFWTFVVVAAVIVVASSPPRPPPPPHPLLLQHLHKCRSHFISSTIRNSYLSYFFPPFFTFLFVRHKNFLENWKIWKYSPNLNKEKMDEAIGNWWCLGCTPDTAKYYVEMANGDNVS